MERRRRKTGSADTVSRELLDGSVGEKPGRGPDSTDKKGQVSG